HRNCLESELFGRDAWKTFRWRQYCDSGGLPVAALYRTGAVHLGRHVESRLRLLPELFFDRGERWGARNVRAGLFGPRRPDIRKWCDFSAVPVYSCDLFASDSRIGGDMDQLLGRSGHESSHPPALHTAMEPRHSATNRPEQRN